MTFSSIAEGSNLSDVLKAFPANSERLLLLAEGVMGGPGELSRGEREAIAAMVSKLNDTGYCVFYHTLFSEVFSGPVEVTVRKLDPLMTYARSLCQGTEEELAAAFQKALDAGWNEQAIYEVVEVCGLFNYINGIARAAHLKRPQSRPNPLPTSDDLRGSYKTMAEGISQK